MGLAHLVSSWTSQRADVDAVVWTGLKSNWQEKRGRHFTVDDATDFLLALEAARGRARAAYDRVRKYLTHAPAGVDTAVRQAMRTRGWNDTNLSSTLFEPNAGHGTES
jgi:hypothetical protein